ncbi:MAG TPA: DUF389 domain-containing protein [Acidobacteriaceae bacterium]|nr:DUF389 domain-containing protein [Acidobacteriaceae bacterium]
MATGTPVTVPAHTTHLQRWLRMNPEQRPAIYAQIYQGADFSSPAYWLEIVFSAGIAALGLVLNSPAVIIGAMLISPLMSPIMATGLALAAGDLYLAIKAIANLIASIGLAVALSAIIVWLLPFHSVTAEVLARINPNLLDLGIALFSGLAGSVAVCRAGTGGGITTLPGVAIAVALMPPLCTMGFGVGSGFNRQIIGGAGLLFLTNLVAIVASAFAVFLLVGMNSPELNAEMVSSRESEVLARRLAHSPFARAVANGGQLRWRILTLVILLAFIAVPLRTAFMQLAGEAVVRAAVQDVVKNLLPPGALVSQQIEIGRGDVAIRLIATQPLAPAKIDQAEKEIERRSGQHASISVSTVASQSELAELTARLSQPPPSPPKPVEQTIPEIDQALIPRVTPVIQSVWPADPPLQSYSLQFGTEGIVLNVVYQAARPLDPVALDLITRECRRQLAAPDLTLNATRVPPPRRATTRR